MKFKEDDLRGNKESAVVSSEILNDIIAFQEELERSNNKLPTQIITPICITQETIEKVLEHKVELVTEGLGWNHWKVIK